MESFRRKQFDVATAGSGAARSPLGLKEGGFTIGGPLHKIEMDPVNQGDYKPRHKEAGSGDANHELATRNSAVQQIGETAGSVWHVLDENGSLSLAKLVEHVGGNRDVVMQAVGWLAREGKIDVARPSAAAWSHWFVNKGDRDRGQEQRVSYYYYSPNHGTPPTAFPTDI